MEGIAQGGRHRSPGCGAGVDAHAGERLHVRAEFGDRHARWRANCGAYGRGIGGCGRGHARAHVRRTWQRRFRVVLRCA